MNKKPSKNGNRKKTPNRENKDKQKEKSPQTDSKTPAYLLEPTEPITDNASVSRYVISYSNPETPEYLNRDLNNDDMVSGPLKKLITYGEKNPAFTAFLFTLLSTVVLAVIRFIYFIFQAGYLQYFGLKASFANVSEKSIVYNVVIAVAVTFTLLAIAEILSHFHIAVRISMFVIGTVFLVLFGLYRMYGEELLSHWKTMIIVALICVVILTFTLSVIYLLNTVIVNLVLRHMQKNSQEKGKQFVSQGYVKIALALLLMVSPLFFLFFIGNCYAAEIPSISSINDNLIVVTENEECYICEPFFIVNNNTPIFGSIATQLTTPDISSNALASNTTTSLETTTKDQFSSGSLQTTTDTVAAVTRKNGIYVIKGIQIFVPKKNVPVIKKMSFSSHSTLEFEQLSIEEKTLVDVVIQDYKKEEKKQEEE